MNELGAGVANHSLCLFSYIMIAAAFGGFFVVNPVEVG
jgi:hypothetical protein